MNIPRSNLTLATEIEKSYFRKAYLAELYDAPIDHFIKDRERPLVAEISRTRRQLIALDARLVYSAHFLDYATQLPEEKEPDIYAYEPHPMELTDAGDGLHTTRPRAIEPNQNYGLIA